MDKEKDKAAGNENKTPSRREFTITYILAFFTMMLVLVYVNGQIDLMDLIKLPRSNTTPQAAIDSYLDEKTVSYKIIEMRGPQKIPGDEYTRYTVTCECSYKRWADPGRADGRNIYFFDLDKKGDEWVVMGAGTGP